MRKELEVEKDDIRKTVIRLLRVNNPSESITGACNNRMQEVVTLRDLVKDLKEENRKLREAQQRSA